MLYGRDAECRVLDGLLRAAREGTSEALLVRGPPGIGKSALLARAADAAGAMTVLRATGVQAEADLPFSTLHQLLWPVFPLLAALPSVQREALGGALGLTPSGSHDRLLVGAGVLSLLAEAGEADGLLCLVDDLQWVDQASADALLFAVRRLAAERVAMVLATRAREGPDGLPPELTVRDLGGLDQAAAAQVLADASSTEAARPVVTRLVAATGGSPLALKEMAGLLRPEHIRGRAPLPEPLPLTSDLEGVYLDRVQQLSLDARTALLVAATDGTGRLTSLVAALDRLGADDGLVEAEASGLLHLGPGDRVEFHHPLVRSAVSAHASPVRRRDVHRALAEVLTDPFDEDRRVWHAAGALVGTDDDVAQALAAAAERAFRRGAPSAAASALQRAADLTSDRHVQGWRLVEVARAACPAGLVDVAYGALEAARQAGPDPARNVEVAELYGLLQWHEGDASEAHRILLEAARAVAAEQPVTAIRLLVHATEAAEWVGDPSAVVNCGDLAEEIDPQGDEEAELHRDYSTGLSAVLLGDTELGAKRLGRVVDVAAAHSGPRWLAWASKAAYYLGLWGRSADLAARAAAAARAQGMTALLVQALTRAALAEHRQGHYAAAAALEAEGIDLAEAIGQQSSAAMLLAASSATAAIRGDESGCQEAADRALEIARPRRLGLAVGSATHALAVSDLVHGRHAATLERLVELAAAGPGESSPSVSMFALCDQVEAAARAGSPDVARQALEQLQPWADRVGTPAAQAIVLRCRALVADGDPAELFSAALSAHPADEAPWELARTRLLYGEWLRRARRRTDAKEQLRAALADFERLGSTPLADRARTELRATGESVHGASGGGLERLTPQELTIASIVAEGWSTKDVAARLFLSPRTVEYHLNKIYPKLGIASRRELARLIR